jgi:hypothetical protein
MPRGSWVEFRSDFSGAGHHFRRNPRIIVIVGPGSTRRNPLVQFVICYLSFVIYGVGGVGSFTFHFPLRVFSLQRA